MLLGEFVYEVRIIRRFYIAGCNVILEAGCLGDTLGRYQLLCKVARVESVSDFADRKVIPAVYTRPGSIETMRR